MNLDRRVNRQGIGELDRDAAQRVTVTTRGFDRPKGEPREGESSRQCTHASARANLQQKSAIRDWTSLAYLTTVHKSEPISIKAAVDHQISECLKSSSRKSTRCEHWSAMVDKRVPGEPDAQCLWGGPIVGVIEGQVGSTRGVRIFLCFEFSNAPRENNQIRKDEII
jgi:hypothetical protein